MACSSCFQGTLHTERPAGYENKLHGLPCYVAEPPEGQGNGVVVIVPDAFGWKFNNNRILADHYANKGNFRVLLPDFMDYIPPAPQEGGSFDTIEDEELWWPWKVTSYIQLVPIFAAFRLWNRGSVVGPRITAFFRELRASTTQSIGAAGFCWGAKYVVLLGSGKDRSYDGSASLIDAAYIAHPSMLSLPQDIEMLQMPLSWSHGTKDFMISPEVASDMERILKRKSNEFDTEFVRYEGALHGFAVRSKIGDETSRKAGEGAELQALAWFLKQLRQHG